MTTGRSACSTRCARNRARLRGHAARRRGDRLRGRRALRPARARRGRGARLARRARPRRAGRHAGLDAIECDLPELAAELARARHRPPRAQLDRAAGVARRRRAAVATIADVARARAERRPALRLSQPLGRARAASRAAPCSTALDAAGGAPLARARPRLGLGGRGRSGRAARARRADGARSSTSRTSARAAAAAFCPVGDGAVGYDRVLPAALAAGVEWLLVEQDETDGPGFDAVARSFDAVQRFWRCRHERAAARVGVVGLRRDRAATTCEGRRRSTASTSSPAPTSNARRRRRSEPSTACAWRSVDDLIADPGIDAILNLTPPARARGGRARRVRARQARLHREAARHVRRRRAEPRRRGGRARACALGCAPDTFLGAAYEAARELIERGAIGEPLGATATMLVGGPDGWHPNADIFYRDGGGPMLDIAPYYLTAVASLLGPFVAATGFAATPTPVRRLGVGPARGRGVQRRRADARRRVAAARERRARDAHVELRGARSSTRAASSCTGARERSSFPTRTDSRETCA